MKLVMTLLVRDEADIIEDHLKYHLAAGVDFVIATDHRSHDGTSEILESYARTGVLRRIPEDGEYTRQGEWQTRMARLAAIDHGADWVINSDADEFWWPRAPSLKEALRSVPDMCGIVLGLVRNFVPRRFEAGSFAERMTFRLAASAPINDPATPFRPVVKAAHRGDPAVRIGEGGSHRVYGLTGSLLRGWYPLEVLHFPLRSREQCAGKYRKTWTGWRENLRGDLSRARESYAAGLPDLLWERVALEDSEVERGLAEGALAFDTRLRDALNPGGAEMARAARRAELDAHFQEAVVFEEAEVVRYHRWADDLTSRLRRLESAR